MIIRHLGRGSVCSQGGDKRELYPRGPKEWHGPSFNVLHSYPIVIVYV